MIKPYIDVVFIFDTKDIINFINTEIITFKEYQNTNMTGMLNTVNTDTRIKDTLIYNAIRMVLINLGYIVGGETRHYNLKYSYLVKTIADWYYPYIQKHVQLEIEKGYLIRTMLVNSNTHLIITKVPINATKNNSRH